MQNKSGIGTRSHRVRVCIVGPSLDILGGQAVQASRLFRRLRDVPSIEVDFLPVNPALPGALRYLQRIKYVRTLVTEAAYLGSLLHRVRQFDVVHVFSASYSSYLLAPLPALVAARAFGKATVLNYRSGEAEDHLRKSPIAVATIRRFADVTVVPSAYLVAVFSRFGLGARSVPNFIEPRRFPFRLRATPRPAFISNRNFERLYNVRCTIDAFAAVKREIPEATLLLAGDGRERRALERRVRDLRLTGVEFVGRVHPDRMAELYDAADVYLNTPDIDNMPGSIIEAYAAGLPVVSTDAAGIPYIVRHEETGLLVPRGNSDAVAAAALRLFREPGLAARLSRTAREECIGRYVWSAIEAQWVSLYHSLVDWPAPLDLSAAAQPELA
jgi:glycosyltransferase involved in cell wall biosynthesis